MTHPTGASRRTRLIAVARRAWPLPVLLTVFFAVGLPSWLVGDGRSAAPDGDAIFTKLCLERGGRPVTEAPTSAGATAKRHCVVRYGGSEYVMDAVTPHGWDGDAAALQQDGCEEAEAQRASTAPGTSRMRFVYHPITGVCERRR